MMKDIRTQSTLHYIMIILRKKMMLVMTVTSMMKVIMTFITNKIICNDYDAEDGEGDGEGSDDDNNDDT